MSFDTVSTFDVRIASFATSSSQIDLGGAWKAIYLVVPTMTSSTEAYIQGSDTATGTYRRVYHPMPANGAPTAVTFIINSAATNSIIPIPNGIRYLKVETSAVVSFTALYQVICSD